METFSVLVLESIVKDVMVGMNLEPWDWVACFAGVLSVIVAVATAWFQYQTEGNTQKMSSAMQVSRLKGFYRHMYRNMVKIRAMQILIEREYENGKYRVPSAEHLLKLKLPEDDVCEEAFYSNTTIFEQLKELKLVVRNVNVEVDVADRYLSSAHASRVAREEILKTLLMKQGAVGMMIKNILTDNFGVTGICNHAKKVIDKSHKDNKKNNIGCQHGKLEKKERFDEESKMIDLYVEATMGKVADETKKTEEYKAKYAELAKEFYKLFNEDVEIELGLNSSRLPKIAMV